MSRLDLPTCTRKIIRNILDEKMRVSCIRGPSHQVSETTKSAVVTEQKEAGVTPMNQKEAAALTWLEAMKHHCSRRFTAMTSMSLTVGGRQKDPLTNYLPKN